MEMIKGNENKLIHNYTSVMDEYGEIYYIEQEVEKLGDYRIYATHKPNILITIDETWYSRGINEEDIYQSYDRIRLLPIDNYIKVIKPLSALVGIKGYTMKVLGNMSSMDRIFLFY
jgi:hypothetical protein